MNRTQVSARDGSRTRERASSLRRRSIARALGVCALAGVTFLGGTATADDDAGDDDDGGPAECDTVRGRFVSHQVAAGCTSPVGFCTAGSLTGGLHGTYAFVMATATASGAAGAPGVTFFTGRSDVSLRDGSALVGTDTGAVDLAPPPFGTGKMVSIITINSGTDGAHGYLQLRGSIDLKTGVVSGFYDGQVCRR